MDWFSGGLRQRVMLGRALMHEPEVLFRDEPTNNLDSQSRLFLWERIRALHEPGVTIVHTTHDMDGADRLCDRIAIMDRGHIPGARHAHEAEAPDPGRHHAGDAGARPGGGGRGRCAGAGASRRPG